MTPTRLPRRPSLEATAHSFRTAVRPTWSTLARLAVAFCLLVVPLAAQVWQTASSGPWEDAATWINPGVPEAYPDGGDDVEVDHQLTIDSDIDTGFLAVDSHLTILAGASLDSTECTVSQSGTLKLEEHALLSFEVLRFRKGSRLIITPEDSGAAGFSSILITEWLHFEGGAEPPRTLTVQPTYPTLIDDSWELFHLSSASVQMGGDGEMFNELNVKNSVLEPYLWQSGNSINATIWEPPLSWGTTGSSGVWSDPDLWWDNGSLSDFPVVASEVYVDGDVDLDVRVEPAVTYLGTGGPSTLRFIESGWIENWWFGALAVYNGSKLIVDDEFDVELGAVWFGHASEVVFRPSSVNPDHIFAVRDLYFNLEKGGVSTLVLDPQYEIQVGDSWNLVGGLTSVTPDDNGDLFGVVKTPPGVLVDIEFIPYGDDGDLRLTVTQTKWSEVGTPEEVTAGVGPRVVIAPDLDGDGALDLVSVNREGDDISVLLGHGDGQFDAPVFYPVGDRPMDLVSADFDGDGALDVAVTVVNDDTLSVRFGVGDGTLSAPTEYVVPSPLGLDVGDLDEDGVADLVVADRDGNMVHVLAGLGDGTFASVGTGATGMTPRDVVLGDLNGDGHLDAVSCNAGTDDVSVLLGSGDGTLSAWADFPVGGNPAQHELIDVDGNGTLDAAIAINDGAYVPILPGLGNGAFGAPVNLTMSTTPARLAFGDIDADGEGDLLVTSGPGNTLSLFRGQGGFGFDAIEEFTTGASPAGILVEDLNADEKPDMVVACADDDLLQYFESTANWARLPGGVGGLLGEPNLAGSGFLVGGEDVTIELTGAVPFAPFFLFLGVSRIDLPFKGGVMVPSPDLLIDAFSTNGVGGFTLPLTWTDNAPGGYSFWTQVWVVDATAPVGAAGTNGLRADVP